MFFFNAVISVIILITVRCVQVILYLLMFWLPSALSS